MLFNSVEFILFFVVVLFLYWNFFSKRLLLSNIFLLSVSYFFYGWWDFRFLSLIFLSSFIDYCCGYYIYYSKKKFRKTLIFFVSLTSNLGILFFFKYYGFFAKELVYLMEQLGYTANIQTLNIILPVGISFYTFQTLSYTIDVYRGKLEPTKDFVAFFAFVSFFPQLVAGPIERAKHLLPQFFQKKEFNYTMASEGFRYMLWGFFAKIAVADSVAPIVDRIFANYETFNAGTLALGAILFSVQIYGDFAGYSNIAIGTAKIFGFDLMQNFNNPYFSCNIREFWSRWHISLSTWFRDYVYIPLGGNKCSRIRNGLNAMATFIISGLWHGANWTFVVWGAIHGFVYILSKPFTLKHTEVNNKVSKLVSIVLTFMVVCFAFIFFRANSINQAFNFIARFFTLSGGETIISTMGILSIAIALVFTITLFAVEWFQRNRTHALEIAHIKPIYRYAIYYSLIFAILYAFQTDRIFIYFQF